MKLNLNSQKFIGMQNISKKPNCKNKKDRKNKNFRNI